MFSFQEIYTHSVMDESTCLWPKQLFSQMKKAYLFNQFWSMDKRFLQKAIESANDMKEKYIIIPDPADTGLIQGVFNKVSGVGIFNSKISTYIDNRLIEKENRPSDTLSDKKNLEILREKEQYLLQSARDKLLQARTFNDTIRQINNVLINESALGEANEKLLTAIFGDKKGSLVAPSSDQAFFGTNAASGPFFIRHFHYEVDRCFILKGNGSSSVSNILIEIANHAADIGFHTCVFYCPFYTDELDGVIIPELKTAILESEEPHKIEPLHPNEVVFPIDETPDKTDALYNYVLELRELEAKYKQFMRQAILTLQDYGRYKRRELEQLSYYGETNADHLLKLMQS
ncbi:MAG: hypothetical protein ACO1OC_09410 [Tuberibacillus sp.]